MGNGRSWRRSIWPAVTVGLAANGLRLRQRVAALDVLDVLDVHEEACPDAEPVAGAHVLVTAEGVEVDAATARAASAHARREGLDALDLVPGDLPAERVIELVGALDPRTYRDDPLAPGLGARTAVLLTVDLAQRVGVRRLTGFAPREMVDLTAEVKRCAPRTTDLAVAPGLRAAAAGPGDAAGRLAALDTTYAVGTPAVLGGRAAAVAALAAGVAQSVRTPRSRRHTALVPAGLTRGARDQRTLAGSARAPRSRVAWGRIAWGRQAWAVTAAAAHALVPVVATRGTALAPRDLPAPVPGHRLVAGVGDLARTVWARERRRWDDQGDLAARRAGYDRLLAGGSDRFLEPRRPDCPLCGSDRLRLEVRAPDLHQGKPGTFRLDRCGACGHVFQNPRLTVEGLSFYYRDFYDGTGRRMAEMAFRAEAPSYRGRATMLDGVAEPRRWLDVGAGHGHFCLIARSIWPKAAFDGLDLAAGVDEAERRGWLDRGIRGSFPDVAPSLAGRYDVVSMHHYLEHTRDPGAELDAVRTVLEPGGLLLVELPDPASRLRRLLGRYWVAWMQPQHQHLLSIEALEAMLRQRGFETIARQRAEPHQPADFTYAVYLAVNHLAPPVDVPWRPPSTAWERGRRGAALAAAAPLLLVGYGLDVGLAPAVRRFGGSNAFRVLARAPG